MAAKLTAVALVVFTGPNAPMAGAVAHLAKSDGTQLLVDITNRDGYAEWNDVPVPFVGMLKIAGTVQYYEQPVTINGDSVTLRVGPSASAPQDILLPAAVPFKHGSALPAAPTRDQMCGVRNQLQGITISRYIDRPGVHHLFDPEIGWWDNKAFRAEAYAAHLAVTLPDGTPQPDTHICLSLDMSGLACLPQLKRVIREAITEGGMMGVMLMCMGDGNDPGEPDNDPGALNFSWLMANFDAIVDFMEDGEDLTPWINFGPGFDGVVPAWQPWSRVNQFIRMARARLNRLKWGLGYLNIEFASGYWSWSGERDDLATPDGQMLDTVLYEYPIDVGPPDPPPTSLLLPDGSDWSPSATNDQRNPWTQVWIINRLIGGQYIRPASQPSNYEPNPQHANIQCPRGRIFVIIWERTTYLWTRKVCDISIVNRQTQVTIDLGAQFY